jgi:hypothetical protein
MRHYEHLKTTRAQQSVYARSSEAAIVTASIREVIATLDEQIAQVERKIRQHSLSTGSIRSAVPIDFGHKSGVGNIQHITATDIKRAIEAASPAHPRP